MLPGSKKVFLAIIIAFFLLFLLPSCGSSDKTAKENNTQKKVGVLLVNHGSRSQAWRNSLIDLEKRVKDSIMNDGSIMDVKTAFMEYTEPSIATRLKEFDKENYSDVILVPVFLTVSTHSFDDIPTLVGQKNDPKSIELFKIEKMERYTPVAKVHIAPLLDFTDLLKKNILRRFKELSKDSKNEGISLIAYGDKSYNTEWTQMLQNAAGYVKQNTGVDAYSYGWCGHLVQYSPDSTAFAVRQVLQKKKSAVVIPVLVAFDEMFQVQIIGAGINKVKDSKKRVLYKPDAILPDKGVEEWVINTTKEYTGRILATAAKNY